jgi:hypothetical protein
LIRELEDEKAEKDEKSRNLKMKKDIAATKKHFNIRIERDKKGSEEDED